MKTENQTTTQKRRRPRRGMSGLTLIEILVVVTILGIIASIVGIQVAGQLEEAQVDTAKVQISNISDGLELYRVKFNRYPSSAEGLNALTNPPKGRKPIMEKIPKDPWDNDYIYVSPGQQNTSKFDLQSKGPDAVADTDDDITNW
ncbi:MAG: type II secretion system major pseudopilin GspG [Myxococcota bacterium]|nr:type II secretion system major pseudopilin GspG [Myxococcota bacterium]